MPIFAPAKAGCSSVRLEYSSGGRVVASSNLVIPTKAQGVGFQWFNPRIQRLFSLLCQACFAPFFIKNRKVGDTRRQMKARQDGAGRKLWIGMFLKPFLFWVANIYFQVVSNEFCCIQRWQYYSIEWGTFCLAMKYSPCSPYSVNSEIFQ